MAKKEPVHKIFEEVFQEDNMHVFRFSIPKYDEYYIGVGRTIDEVQQGYFSTKTKRDMQSLTMIEAPIVLDYMYPEMTSILTGYNDIRDSYPEIDIDGCYLKAMNRLIIDVHQSFSNVRESIRGDIPLSALSEAQVKQLEALNLAEENKIKDLEEVVSRDWLGNANPIAKALIGIGYTPIWIKYGIRTRTLTLIRQAGNSDSYKIISMTEFIPRDERKNCTYVSMNEILLTANAVNALIKKDQKESEKENK